MKKSLLSLFTVLCALSFFTACSDDDKVDYSGTYEGEKLVLKLGDIVQTDKSVNISSSDFVMNNVIAGEATTKVPVTFTDTKFSGTDTNADRIITVDGSIENNILTANVTLKLTNTLVGTWSIYDGNITAKVEAPAGTKLFFLENELTVEQYQMILPALMGSMPQAYLKDITFKDNGFLVANYDAAGEAGGKNDSWQSSPENAVRWYVKENQVYLVPNLSAIMPKSTGPNLGDMLANGIPLNFVIKDGVLNAYVTKDQMLPMMDIIIGLVANIDSSDNIILGMMKLVLPEMKQTLEKCTKFELGMNLKK